MGDIVQTEEGSDEVILIAEERMTYRRAFRSIDPRHICIVDVDSVTISEEDLVAALEVWLATHPSWWRVYRTAGGCRLIEVSELWYPRSHVVLTEIMTALHADPVYVHNFVKSFEEGREAGTFSARIDPKPWRMETGGATKAELLEMTDEEYETYLENYGSDKLNYRVAHFLGVYGNDELEVHPWAQAVIDYHDAECRVSSLALPLA